MARFNDSLVSRENLFSLGRDDVSGDYYLSIPVSNRMVDYEEYYRISPEQFQAFSSDLDAAAAFAGQCRSRRCDDRLILKPGTDRGKPR